MLVMVVRTKYALLYKQSDTRRSSSLSAERRQPRSLFNRNARSVTQSQQENKVLGRKGLLCLLW